MDTTQQSTYKIDFPADLSFTLNIEEKELSHEIKRLALIKLFEMGKITSGRAANILGISRIAFFDLLGQYQVDIYNDTDEETLKKDRENA